MITLTIPGPKLGGGTHEHTAVQEYQNSVSNNHDDLEIMSAGYLHNPFIGATPDGMKLYLLW